MVWFSFIWIAGMTDSRYCALYLEVSPSHRFHSPPPASPSCFSCLSSASMTLSVVVFSHLFCFSDSTYKWNHIFVLYCQVSISFSIIPCRSSHVVTNVEISFILCLSNSSSCAYITSSLSIHKAASISWLL